MLLYSVARRKQARASGVYIIMICGIAIR